MPNLSNVLTITEAAELYQLDESTLKKACTGQKGYPPRFKENEYRKAGKVWLITREGMERLYGKQ